MTGGEGFSPPTTGRCYKMEKSSLEQLKDIASKAKKKVKDKARRSMFKTLTDLIAKLLEEQRKANELQRECNDLLKSIDQAIEGD